MLAESKVQFALTYIFLSYEMVWMHNWHLLPEKMKNSENSSLDWRSIWEYVDKISFLHISI